VVTPGCAADVSDGSEGAYFLCGALRMPKRPTASIPYGRGWMCRRDHLHSGSGGYLSRVSKGEITGYEASCVAANAENIVTRMKLSSANVAPPRQSFNKSRRKGLKVTAGERNHISIDLTIQWHAHVRATAAAKTQVSSLSRKCWA
jgi:hypothetical protein